MDVNKNKNKNNIESDKHKDNIVLIIVVICTIIISYYSTSGFKSQFVRLIDVFVIGPLLIYIGFFVKEHIKWAKYPLIITGIATIVYNGKNYLVQS
jgi:hypothetical protein